MNHRILKRGAALLGGLLLSVSLALSLPGAVQARNTGSLNGEVAVAQLPVQAQQTLALIESGGPFPYAKDGAVFGNYERVLPQQRRGYYREYTVPTPHARNRGARRIISGGDRRAPSDYFYTDDHYSSFRRIRK